MSNAAEAQGTSSGWDVYWQGMRGNPAHKEGGTHQAPLQQLWRELFSDSRYATGQPRCLELACGSGAVSAQAAAVSPALALTCTDVSASALQLAGASLPGATLVVADAGKLPFRPQSFELVFSQFGVEYAGTAAMQEAASMVAPGGQLALVVHMADGAIYREYAVNLEAVEALRDAEVLSLARGAFVAGYALNGGTGSVAAFKAAEQAFQPAVRSLEAIFRRYGEAVADGLPRQLYRDIAHMYPRMSAYQPQDIFSWLDTMATELDAYEVRLTSMLNSAMDEASVQAFTAACAGSGLTVQRRDVLQMGEPESPSGWLLVLERAAA